MKLITNWRAALGHYSTVALAVVSALQGFLVTLPESILERAFQIHTFGFTLGQVLVALTVISGLLGLIGKFIDQTPKDAP